MQPLLLAALLLTTASMSGLAVNELSHGMAAEILGFGHRHMFDNGGYHCTPHDSADHAEAHKQHMHDDNKLRHDSCPGGAQMHNQGGPMHPGGPRDG